MMESAVTPLEGNWPMPSSSGASRHPSKACASGRSHAMGAKNGQRHLTVSAQGSRASPEHGISSPAKPSARRPPSVHAPRAGLGSPGRARVGPRHPRCCTGWRSWRQVGAASMVLPHQLAETQGPSLPPVLRPGGDAWGATPREPWPSPEPGCLCLRPGAGEQRLSGHLWPGAYPGWLAE